LSKIENDKGDDSLEWKLATNTYSEMIWSTQVEAKQESDKQQVLRRIPKIVNSVRKLFHENGMSDGAREAILNYMFRIHMQIVKGTPLMEIDDDFGRVLGGDSLKKRAKPPVDVMNVSAMDEQVLGVATDESEKINRSDPSLAYKYAQENTQAIDFGAAHEESSAGNDDDENSDTKSPTAQATDGTAEPVSSDLTESSSNDVSEEIPTNQQLKSQQLSDVDSAAPESSGQSASESPSTAAEPSLQSDSSSVEGDSKNAPSQWDENVFDSVTDPVSSEPVEPEESASSSEPLSGSPIVENEDSFFTGQEELAEAFEAAKNYRVGEMFEFQRDGLKHRYQLTHVSNIFGKYTFREFGNRALIEINKPDLVIEVLRGSVAKISSNSLFDNSLESVISQIRGSNDEANVSGSN
jgi:hypothetical protein